uniref:Uncharacterized protein n=1 Tax=Populus trichocarpa TaxID=3694 RepID=A0A2K2CCI8_POPTR
MSFRVKTVISGQNRVHRVNTGQTMSTRKNPGGFHRFLRLIWPEKDRDRRLPPKLQVVDSRSSAINDRQDHHHKNPRHQIYQDRPSVVQKYRRKISPPPTVAARVPHAPPVAFS